MKHQDTKGKSGDDLKNESYQLIKAEEELQATHQRFQLLIDATHIGFWDWNVKTGETYYNLAYYTMLGYRKDGLSTKNSFFDQLLHPDEKERVQKIISQCVEGNVNQFEHEFRMRTLKESWIWILSRGKCVERDNNGKALRIVGTHENITDRRQVQTEIDKKKKIMAQAEELADTGSWEWDIKNDIWLVSDNWRRIHGCFTSRLTSSELLVIAHPEDRPAIEEAFAKAIENKEPYEIQHRIIRQNTGEIRHVYAKGVLEFDDSGKQKTMVGAVQDITESKQAEKALLESEEMMRNSQSVAHIGSYSTILNLSDLKKSSWVCSPEFYKIFGIDETYPHTIEGWAGFIHPDYREELIAYHESVVKNKESFNREYKIIRINDGTERWVQGTGELVYDKHGKPIRMHGAIQDITDRKNAQEDIIKERKQLLSIFNSIDEIIYISDIDTHEILYINKKSEEILKKNCIGKKCYKEFQNLDSPCSFCTNSIIKANNKQPYYWEFHNHFLEKDFAITDRLIDWTDGRKVRFEIAIDITLQKKAERALRASEKRFKNMFERHSAIMLLINPTTGEILDANESAINFYGYSKPELLSMNISKINVLSSYQVKKEHTRALLNQQNYFVFQHKIANGELRTVEVHSSPISIDNTQILFSIIHDITQRKQAEEELQKLSKAVEQSPAILVITNKKGIIEYVNPMFTKVTGYTAAEALGKNPGILKSGNQSKQFYQHLWETILNGKDWQGEMLNRKKDGTVYWESALISPVFDKKGRITHFMAIKEDITYRKQAEEVLKSSELRFKNILQNVETVAVQGYTMDGTVIYWNRASVDFYGYTEEEAMGRNLLDLIIPLELKVTVRKEIETMKKTGKAIPASEITLKRKNGSLITVYSSHSYVKVPGKEPEFFCIDTDLTERKKAEQTRHELEIANKTARFKQNFLANMSHEIRTPLTGVLGMIEIMEHTSLNHDQRDYLNTIKVSGENLREIINQVLDYSKIEAGKVSIQPRVFEFKTIPLSAESLFKNNVSTGVKLQNTIDPKIPTWIEADNARLSQVLNNLVSNAVKFTSQGTITIQSSLIFSDTENGEVVIKMEVRDTGKGIPDDMQTKLFVPFSQVEAIDTRNFEGTGLGLSISRQLVTMMDGEIGVTSKEGMGSTFWFTFPAKTAHKPQLPVPDNAAPAATKKLRILLAEDKVINQKVMRIMLSSMGHEVHIVRNGLEAINLFQPGRFDLIFMDIQMPEMDGVTATQKLKEKHKDLPPLWASALMPLKVTGRSTWHWAWMNTLPNP